MNMDGMTGYDYGKAADLQMNIMELGVEVLAAFYENGQKDFVDKMAENWACKEAQNFFADYQKKSLQAAKEVNENIHKMMDLVKEGANKWNSEINADKNGLRMVWNNDISPLDISNIKENFN